MSTTEMYVFGPEIQVSIHLLSENGKRYEKRSNYKLVKSFIPGHDFFGKFKIS